MVCILCSIACLNEAAAREDTTVNNKPTPVIIFDTDMGNDIDDALAQLMAHRASAAGRIQFPLVTSSNASPWAVPGIQAILKYYKQDSVEVGGCAATIGLAHGAFTQKIAEEMHLPASEARDAVKLLRKVLHEQKDGSVRVVVTGFSTNLAILLDTEANHEGDAIPLSGKDLIRQKVEFLSMMAGDSERPEFTEFNVKENIPAARKVLAEWPTPVYISGYEIGSRVFSRGDLLQKTLLPDNPVWVAYKTFFQDVLKDKKWDRPSWDQTAMLWALEPDKGHFDLKGPGTIEVGEKGETLFSENRPSSPARYFLRFKDSIPSEKIEEILQSWYAEPGAELKTGG